MRRRVHHHRQPVLEQLSGLTQAQLVNCRLTRLLPGLVASDLPEQEEREAELVGADGQSVPVRVLRKDISLGHKRQTVIAFRDQRERLRSEARLRTLAFTDAVTGLPNRAVRRSALAPRRRPARAGGRLRRPDARPRPLQVRQRHPRARDGRRVAAQGRRPPAIRPRRGGRRRAFRRRRFAILLLDKTAVSDPKRSPRGSSRRSTGPSCSTISWSMSARASASPSAARTDMTGTNCCGTPTSPSTRRKPRARDVQAVRARLAAQMLVRSRLEADMRRALTAGEFELHYQPLVDAQTGAVTAAEAWSAGVIRSRASSPLRTSSPSRRRPA